MIGLALLLAAQAGTAPQRRLVMPSITGLDRLCPEGDGSEIIVCARRSLAERQRVHDPGPPPIADRDTTPLGFSVGRDAQVGAEVQSFTRPDGSVNNAIMAKFKLRF